MDIVDLTTHFIRNDLKPGAPIRCRGLTLVPVHHRAPGLEYIRFGDAAPGTVLVTEMQAGATVPELQVQNLGARPVLFVEGEVLVGLNQDRTLNVTVMAPAFSTVAIPVACVEAGRWSRASTYATGGNLNLSPKVRHAKSAETQRQVRQTGRFSTNQGVVWDSVAERLAAHRIASNTSAFRDLATDARWAAAAPEIAPPAGARGVVALVGDRLAAADIFDREDTLAAAWAGLVRSYAFDLETTRGTDADDDTVERLVAQRLGRLAGGVATTHPGVGTGDIVQLTQGTAVASALVADSTVVHLAALWGPEADEAPDTPMRLHRPSRRRDWYSTMTTETR